MHAVTAIAYLLLAWYAARNAVIAHDQTSPVLHIPWSVGYGCLATGLALIAVCSLTRIARHVIGREPVRVDLADPGAATV
jgi:TRAP-type C4-dicarboxylate transport system permease small subunit